MAEVATVSVGQKVYWGVYGARNGIVFAIHGEQQPAAVRSLGGGIVMSGGRAEFDIVFDDGSITRRLPECILRGVQWRIFDKIATADEIAAALHFAEHEEARLQTEKEQTEARRAAECVEHLRNYPYLKPRDQINKSCGVASAMNIRTELKRIFGKFKFSVTSDHNSVRVRWTDGPTSDQVNAIVKKYSAGNFDGMTDCYEYNPDATFAKVFGGARYIFTTRDESIDGLRKAYGAAGGDPDAVPEGWNRGDCWKLPEEIREAIRDAWSAADLR